MHPPAKAGEARFVDEGGALRIFVANLLNSAAHNECPVEDSCSWAIFRDPSTPHGLVVRRFICVVFAFQFPMVVLPKTWAQLARFFGRTHCNEPFQKVWMGFSLAGL